MYNIHLYLITILSFINFKALGTAQVPDYLIFEGDTLAIQTNPLESYFEGKSRPEIGHSGYSTANWRGYIGYWEIIDGELYLLKLESEYDDEIDLSSIFPQWVYGVKLHADWFNDSILAVYGDIVHYEHMGYGSIYEYEKEFLFSKGTLVEIKDYKTKSRKSKYTKDLKLLFKYFQDHIDYSTLEHLDSSVVTKVYVKVSKVSDEGKIEDVEILKGVDSLVNKEAIRVLKSIPEWDVYYHRGKPFIPNFIFRINFKK